MAPVGVGPGVAKPTPGDELSVGEALTKKRQDLAEFMGCSIEVVDDLEALTAGKCDGVYRTTAVRRTHGTNRAEVSSGEADATKAGQRKRERTVAEAQAERAPGGAFVLSARPRENSHEGVPENNETRFKTDEEKSGWWEALKKRFYRDMG